MLRPKGLKGEELVRALMEELLGKEVSKELYVYAAMPSLRNKVLDPTR